MKTITIRLPEPLAAALAAEASERGITKSDVVRERLQRADKSRKQPAALADIADVIGSVDDDRPADLSARKKHHLRATGYGRNHSR